MQLLENVKEIFKNHPFSLIYTDGYKNVYDLIRAHNELSIHFNHPELNDSVFISKYKNNIPNRWYGFSIGTPINPVWLLIIDEVLSLCIDNDKNFEIYQIKTKFGRIEFNVRSNIIDDIKEISNYISSNLYDNALIY